MPMTIRRLAALVATVFVVSACASGVIVDEGQASIDTQDLLTITAPDDGVTVTNSVVTVTGTAPDGADVVRDVTLGRDDHATAFNGEWSMEVELDEGENLLTFRVGDDDTTSATLFLVYAPTATTTAVDPSSDTETPALSEEPTPTAEPAPTADAASTLEPEPMPLTVKVVRRTSSVPRNAKASLTIKTTKGARCSITVEYPSGPSQAKGLGDKTAKSNGQVTWKWKVGGNTTKGRHSISVYCQKGARYGSVGTSFRVR
jgi:hypothetical protein